jgi:hypothetical protein
MGAALNSGLVFLAELLTQRPQWSQQPEGSIVSGWLGSWLESKPCAITEIDLLREHLNWPYPDSLWLINREIDYEQLLGLAVASDRNQLVLAPLEVPVATWLGKVLGR